MHSLKHVVGYSFPFVVFFIFYAFYAHWVFTAREILKISGWVAIVLLTITFAVGPLSKFLTWVNSLKVFRKYWGESAVVAMALHIGLAVVVRYKLDIGLMFSTRNPYWIGFYFGFVSFLYFLFMVAISNQYSMQKLDHRWKQLQSFGYVAFVFAITHIVLLETKNGIFEIRRPLGRVAFAFAIAVVILRLYVWLLTIFKNPKETLPVTNNSSRNVPPNIPSA